MVKQWLLQLKQMASLEEKKKVYVAKQGHRFKRKITHIKYPEKYERVKTGRWSNKLRLEITDQDFIPPRTESINGKVYIHIDNLHLQVPTAQTVLPIWGGGFSSIFGIFSIDNCLNRRKTKSDCVFISIFILIWFSFFLHTIMFLCLTKKTFTIGKTE